MKALIIGAGIGGMAAAAALKNAGVECEVYEAVSEIKPVGAAISIWPNGVKCMNTLGMGHILHDHGGPMNYLSYREFQQGKTMTRFSLQPLVEQVGESPYPIARSALQSAMLSSWGKDKVQFSKRVSAVGEDGQGVFAEFTDGDTARADFLIAADGTHSIVRPYVLGYTPERRYAGYVNWNGLVDIDETLAPADQWTTYVGEGKRVSLMPVADRRFYFFFDVPLPKGLAENRNSARTDLQRYFAGWCPEVQQLITRLNTDEINRVEIHDVEPLGQLVRGRIALLGDAAHSTTPDIGQGGCAALEDAVVLGQIIAGNPMIEEALQQYNDQRRDRVRDLILKARKRCDITHGRNMKLTHNWYQQLYQETGEGIINGLRETILGGPLG